MEKNLTPYEAGRDCAVNGPNEINCHFTLFSTPEKTKQWEEGKKSVESNLAIKK